MKLFLCLFIFPIVLFAQDIPKGATKIIISNNLSGKENFNLAVKTLFDNDYFFEQRDSTLGYIKTQEKKLKSSGYITLNIRTIDNQIQISGFTKLGAEVNLGLATILDKNDPIKNAGMKGSLMRKSFEAMDEISLKFLGTKTYN